MTPSMWFMVWGVMPLVMLAAGAIASAVDVCDGDLGRRDRRVAWVLAGAALPGARSARCRSRPPIRWPRPKARAVGSFPDRCRPSTTSVKQRSPLLQRSIFALLSAEVISSLGAQMTFLALPWFVLTTTGSTTRMGIVLAAELLPIALLGIPSGAVVSTPGCGEGDARLRLRPRAADGVDTSAVRGRPPRFRSCWCLSSCSAASSRRTSPPSASCCRSSSARTRRRSRRRTHSWRRARGSRSFSAPCRGTAHRVDRRRQRPLRGRRDVRRLVLPPPLFVPTPPLPVTADNSGLFAGLRFVFARPVASADARDRRLSAHVRAGDFVSLPVLAYVHYGASARTAGLMFGAFGAGSVIGSLLGDSTLTASAPLCGWPRPASSGSRRRCSCSASSCRRSA